MKKRPETQKEWLLLALESYEISVVQDKEGCLEVENDYTVEIEQNGVFKLLHEGKVVAPFMNLDELCSFIKMG
ncbi:MAG: hypothetical protein HC892_16240 [Saprospiraceae bacterium]|nr:hypothetical protein [Saprospiraceae bacterium]